MRKILLVDDEFDLVETMARALKRYPTEFSIVAASNGAEAISILEREQIDLISTDLNMPVMNGFHLLVYILQNCPTIPVLVVTAFDTSTIRERISKRGFSSITYIQKPFSLKYYVATVREQLNTTSLGHIEGISLFNILQLLQLEQKTCALRIYSTQGEGNLSFVDGELVNAWCNDIVGPEAVYMVMSWSDVRIDMRDNPTGSHRTITHPLSHLLMESVRRQDEANPVHEMEELDFRGSEPITSSPQDDEQVFGQVAATLEDAATLDDAELFIEVPRESLLDDTDLFTEPSPEAFSQSRKDYDMSNVKQSLEEAMKTIDGAVGVALVDYQSGMALGIAGGSSTLNLEVAAAGNTEVIRAKMKVMSSLGLKDSIEDILITLGSQYHLLRLLKSTPGLFLYLALSKSQANLAMARHQLAQIENNLSV
jgi:CheY-like chemotaxis protein